MKAKDPYAELGGTLDETFTFNVEHVIPQSHFSHWDVSEQVGQQFRKRLGNQVLLNPGANVKLGNAPFKKKRKAFTKSPLLLTQAVGAYKKWGPAEIDE